MLQTYRDRRKSASTHTHATTRAIVESGLALEADNLAATVSPVRMAEIESVVDATIAGCVSIASRLWGFNHEIRARHDWTWRTAKAKAPRSRGGKYSRRFLALDQEYHRNTLLTGDTSERQPGISLRLAKYLKPRTMWGEYSAFDAHTLIGGRNDIAHDDVLRFLTAHECAHAIDFGLPINTRHEIGVAWIDEGQYVRAARRVRQITIDGVTAPMGAHESSWQGIYRTLRDELGLNALGSTRAEKKKTTTHECIYCGSEFEATKPARFCSSRCRTADHRQRATAAAEYFASLTDDERISLRAAYDNMSELEIYNELEGQHEKYIYELMEEEISA